MKSSPSFLISILVLAGCYLGAEPAKGPVPREEISFTYHEAFAPDSVIHLTRDSQGTVEGVVFRYSRSEPSVRVVLKNFYATSETFDGLVAVIESLELKDAAEHHPMIGMDGYSFVFSHVLGNRFLKIKVWGPEIAPENPNSKIAIPLSTQFAQVAGAKQLIKILQDLKQLPEPTLSPSSPRP